LITAFAQGFAGERFCANCLASRVGTDVYAVREALTEIASNPDGFSVESRRCGGCARRARTLSYDGHLDADERPYCRVCARPIGDDENPLFPAEGGVVHGACFREAQGPRAIEGGSDLGRLAASTSRWSWRFDAPPGMPEYRVNVETCLRAVAWSRELFSMVQTTRDRSRAVRRVAAVVRNRAEELRSGPHPVG
jgi:hypothetical protein